MKHMYISNCHANAVMLKSTNAELNNYLQKMKEHGKEHGFDVIFWGNPWGVPESLSFVVTSDKSLDKYVEWRGSWGQAAAKAKLASPFDESNTVIVTSF
jgi:hypothetical protein